jgi:hypothetical protein
MKTYKITEQVKHVEIIKISFDKEDDRVTYSGLVYIKMPKHYFDAMSQILADNDIDIIIPHMQLSDSNYVIFNHTLVNYEFQLDELNNTLSLVEKQYSTIITEE